MTATTMPPTPSPPPTPMPRRSSTLPLALWLPRSMDALRAMFVPRVRAAGSFPYGTLQDGRHDLRFPLPGEPAGRSRQREPVPRAVGVGAGSAPRRSLPAPRRRRGSARGVLAHATAARRREGRNAVDRLAHARAHLARAPLRPAVRPADDQPARAARQRRLRPPARGRG